MVSGVRRAAGVADARRSPARGAAWRCLTTRADEGLASLRLFALLLCGTSGCASSPFAGAPSAADAHAYVLRSSDTAIVDPALTQAPNPADVLFGPWPFEQPPLGSPDGEALPTWQQAVSEQRWEDAEAILDRVVREYEDGGVPAELRYARARVALERGDRAASARQLEELELELPELEPEIQRLRSRARAQPQTLPRDVQVAHWLQRAKEQAAANRRVEAWLSVERALGLAQRVSERAEARALRVELVLARGLKYQAITDLRWLALQAPLTEPGRSAPQALRDLAPAQALGPREHLQRARAYADRGRVEDVESELAMMQSASGPAPARAEREFVLATALYESRVAYASAALAFDRAAEFAGPERVRALYFAGRAWERAADLDQAATRYQAVMRAPAAGELSSWAAFRLGRVRSYAGHFEQAIGDYKAYLTQHGGSFAPAAYRELGIAEFAIGRYASAAGHFERSGQLSRHATDRAMAELLWAISQASAGQERAARRTYEALASAKGLSFPGLLALARLQDVAPGEPSAFDVPSVEMHAAIRPPLPIDLPQPVVWLHQWGFQRDALEGFDRRRQVFQGAHSEQGEAALCQAYAALGHGNRAYALGYERLRGSGFPPPAADNFQWWECAYPQPLVPQVTEAASRWRVPSSLVYAVMRQESAFRAEVVSPAGAIGMMQIMPATGRQLAEELGVPFSEQRLKDADYNVQLGVYYLAQLLEQFQDRMPFAVAAYNAGPDAVASWLQHAEGLPLELQWARIPFEETRHYVARVLENEQRYRELGALSTSLGLRTCETLVASGKVEHAP